MGFNKRIIHKETIDRNINDLGYVIKLTNADALIMDYWSSSFFDNLNIKWKDYQNKRQEILNDTQFESNLSILQKHTNFDKLKNISNIYYNLVNSPSWVDILLLTSIVEIEIPDDKSGKFDELVNLCVEKINSKYHKHE